MSAGTIKILVAGSDGVVISEYLLGNGEHIVGSVTGSAIPLESAAPAPPQWRNGFLRIPPIEHCL
jgi:hypothetical protein